MKHLLFSLFAILVLVGIIYGATVYSGFIKQQVAHVTLLSAGKVLGTEIGVNNKDITDPKEKNSELQNAIQQVVSGQIDNVKKDVLNIKVSDVLNTFDQGQKMVHDAQSAQTFVEQTIQDVTSKKK